MSSPASVNAMEDMQSKRLKALTQSVVSQFEQRYSRRPEFVVAAPGRVNLIGEHIDYNDGYVMPMAIDRYVVFAASPTPSQPGSSTDNPTANLYSVNLEESLTIPLGQTVTPDSVTGWAKYIGGVIAGFQQRGNTINSFDAVFESNVPLGGGLSSSAALEVATATLLESLTGKVLPNQEKALLCQKAEHDFAGVPCGIMDQFSSVFGRNGELMLLDCQSEAIERVSFTADRWSVLIVNSNVKHELVGGEYAERRQQCDDALTSIGKSSWRDVTLDDVNRRWETMPDLQRRRARHVVTEIDRTVKAAQAFRSGDWSAVGKLMYDSHDSLRDDYDVSCDELDLLVNIARRLGPAHGIAGSRMTGGGFGGCTVTLVESSAVPQVIQLINDQYHAATSIVPDCFASRPARGAHVVEPLVWS